MEQKALIVHYDEGLSIRETADVLGVNVYTAQNILVRARKKLGMILVPQLVRRGSVRETSSRGLYRASA